MKELKKIGVINFALVIGLITAVFGLIIGVYLTVFGAFMGSIAGAMGMGIGAAFGILTMILFPMIAFFDGFIGGAIFAIIYNFIASRYKGIQIELK